MLHQPWRQKLTPFSPSYRSPPASVHRPLTLAQNQRASLHRHGFAHLDELIVLPALDAHLLQLNTGYTHYAHHLFIALHVAIEPAAELTCVQLISLAFALLQTFRRAHVSLYP